LFVNYLFIYFSLKNQNFGSWMVVFKLLLIVSFYRFLIEKYNCTADKQLNWHWYFQQHDQAWTLKLSLFLSHNLVYLLYLYPSLDHWTYIKLVNKDVA